jgi:hypothetical protein
VRTYLLPGVQLVHPGGGEDLVRGVLEVVPGPAHTSARTRIHQCARAYIGATSVRTQQSRLLVAGGPALLLSFAPQSAEGPGRAAFAPFAPAAFAVRASLGSLNNAKRALSGEVRQTNNEQLAIADTSCSPAH